MHSKVLRQRRIFPHYSLVHRIGNSAVRHVSGGTAAQFGDVHHLGEVHLEQRPFAKCERDRILCVLCLGAPKVLYT